MSLLIFHLVFSNITFEGVDIRMAQRILDYHIERYPNGAYTPPPPELPLGLVRRPFYSARSRRVTLRWASCHGARGLPSWPSSSMLSSLISLGFVFEGLRPVASRGADVVTVFLGWARRRGFLLVRAWSPAPSAGPAERSDRVLREGDEGTESVPELASHLVLGDGDSKPCAVGCSSVPGVLAHTRCRGYGTSIVPPPQLLYCRCSHVVFSDTAVQSVHICCQRVASPRSLLPEMALSENMHGARG